MKEIVIITDSGCDLDLSYLKELDVELIPITAHFGDETYEDRVTISTRDFYEKLQVLSGVPKTSQITPLVYVEKFEPHIKNGKHVLYISFSSGLSGTYQSACIAADMLNSSDITIIDSKGASVGFGLIVREASIMRKEGKTIDEIINRVIFMRDRMEYIFAVGSLEMLKRGGRLSKGQALMGTLLNIKPILQFEDGFIVPYEKVRGQKAIIKMMIETMKDRGYDLSNQTIGLNYSKDIELCMILKEEIQKEFGVSEFLISEIGAAIGSHVGAGTTSVFFMRK